MLALMSECRQAKKSIEGKSHLVCTGRPGEVWLRKKRWEEAGGRPAEVDGEGRPLPQYALWTFSGAGHGAVEGLSHKDL